MGLLYDCVVAVASQANLEDSIARQTFREPGLALVIGFGELQASWIPEQSPLPLLGLRDTEWPGRTQVLRRGPVTWYLDGAHTASSVQACVRWYCQSLQRNKRPSG